MLINYSHKYLSQCKNAYTLNRTYLYTLEVEKTSVAGIGIFHETWDISIVADTLAPRIARSSVLTK